MKVAIIGGGITGLTAAYTLSKNGHAVTVFEKEPYLGGLAGGWKPARNASASGAGGEKGWDWSLEKSYHHLFTNDKAIIGLMGELGLSGKLIIKRPVTANLVPASRAEVGMRVSASPPEMFALRVTRVGGPPRRGPLVGVLGGKPEAGPASDPAHLALLENAYLPARDFEIAQLDSPLHLLQFPGLSMVDKLRTGALAAFCKVYPFWQTLEGVTAKQFFVGFGGKKAWEIIWEPLMTGKFGHYDSTIAASWLWARIHKRTSSLCYIEGGFATLVDALEQAIKRNGGKIHINSIISTIGIESRIMNHESWNTQNHNSLFTIHNSTFDNVLFTTPTPIAYKLLPAISNPEALSIPHLHTQTLILETDKPVLKDVYWLNITDRSFPFLAVVAHTNFMDKKHYGGRHITYIGNYLPDNHPYLSMTKEQLLRLFLPFINRLNPSLNSKLKTLHSFLFTAPFAQPVHQLYYSKRAPKMETPMENVYLANMDSIYPWDRGTNYAVELGLRAARTLNKATK